MYLIKGLVKNYSLVCVLFSYIETDKTTINFNLDSKGFPRAVATRTLKKRRPASRPLGQILRTTDNNFIDFIRRCFEFVENKYDFLEKQNYFLFRWDPLERLTPEEGLRHPWIIETRLKRSSHESRTRYKAKKDETTNNNNTINHNISTINGDSCNIFILYLIFLLIISSFKIVFSLNETTGHEDALATEEDKQITNSGTSMIFPRISNQ